jgi:hypothetical protein
MHTGSPVAANERQGFTSCARARALAQARERGDTRLWFEFDVAANGVENV